MIAFFEHTLLRAVLPEHMLEFGILVIIGYALMGLDYKQVTQVGFMFGVIEGFFSIAPFSIFVISYILVGNTLVFIGRNITAHGRITIALVGSFGALVYILVNGILLYIFFQFNMSEVTTSILHESWSLYLVVSGGGALAALFGRMIAVPLTHSRSLP